MSYTDNIATPYDEWPSVMQSARFFIFLFLSQLKVWIAIRINRNWSIWNFCKFYFNIWSRTYIEFQADLGNFCTHKGNSKFSFRIQQFNWSKAPSIWNSAWVSQNRFQYILRWLFLLKFPPKSFALIIKCILISCKMPLTDLEKSSPEWLQIQW